MLTSFTYASFLALGLVGQAPIYKHDLGCQFEAETIAEAEMRSFPAHYNVTWDATYPWPVALTEGVLDGPDGEDGPFWAGYNDEPERHVCTLHNLRSANQFGPHT